MTTLARGNSGLQDNQCLSLMHHLMREGSNAEPPTAQQWNDFVDDVSRQIRAGTYVVPPRSRGLLERLETARSEVPDGPRFYSVQRIMQRSILATQGHSEWIAHQASVRGVPQETIAHEFESHFEDASRNSRLRPSAQFRQAFLSEPQAATLLTDQRSLYAYEAIENRSREARAQRPSRRAVERVAVNSSAIAEMGFDPVSGRVEVVMQNNPDRTYAYRMTAEEYRAFAEAPSLGAYFARNVRGNPDYQYATQAEADEGVALLRCATCGQFADAEHSCPPIGSETAVNRDLRQAAEQRGAATTRFASASRMPRTRGQRLRSEDGSLAIHAPTLSRLRQEARRQQSVMAPVRANVLTGQSFYHVTGSVLVEYQGRGNGYSVEAVTAPGDSRRDNLRCNCPQYQAEYRCPHIDAVVTAVNTNLNGLNAPAISEVAAARASVVAGLAEEYQSSVAATAASTAAFQPVAVSFEENPQIFQEMYDEARAARTAYREAVAAGQTPEYPVPFATENALGGLATRESGRGFGTEIEFSFPSGMSAEDRRAALTRIGQELYDLGLTRSANQKPYGDSHGWVRDQHERGWAFEEDPSTGGYWGDDTPVAGGEIIAPIMYDEPESWQNIKSVCDVLKRNGAIPSKNAGLHVHVGVGDYDHRVENHNRLLSAVAEHEDLLYRMSSNPERGTHRGQYYCAPNHVPAAPYRTVSQAKNSNDGHSLAVNLQSIRGRDSDHVEFRTFDSSLEPAAIQAHIAMSVFMAEGATRPNTVDLSAPSTRHPLGERYAANPRRGVLTGSEWLQATASIRSFIDRFVPGSGGDETQNHCVRQMVSLFAMTRWQRGR